MSPRKRNRHNKPFPTGWRFRYNAYYYMVPKSQRHRWDGKSEFRLGGTQAEAYRVWAERMEYDGSEIETFQKLADRYRLETIPNLSITSQESYLSAVANLTPVFGEMETGSILPKHANRYYDIVSREKTPAVAKSEVSVLRAMLSQAVKWGVIDSNLLIGQLRLKGAGTRNRYVEDWEVDAALSLPPTKNNAKGTGRGVVTCQLLIEFKLATGLRRGDILRLPLLDHSKPEIEILLRKTATSSGKKLIIEWTDELHDIVRDIEAIPPRRIGSSLLFTNRNGNPYYNEKTGKALGFNSVWQRFMRRVVSETQVSEPFQEKDIRAKFGSDAESLQAASDELGHTNTSTTIKHYRRGPTRFTARTRKRM